MNDPTRIYWDTGVYCGINKDVFPLLIEAERRDNVTAYAHPHVVLELMCKLSDWMNVQRYGSGLAGMKRLHKHCRDTNGLRLLHAVERQVEMTMFGRVFDPALLAEGHEDATRIVDECATIDPAAWSRNTRLRIAEVAAYKEKTVGVGMPKLMAAAQDAKAKGMKTTRSTTPTWEEHIQVMLAKRLVDRTANTFGVSLDSEEARQHTESVLNTYAIAIQWETLTIINAYDHANAGPNNLWDAQILYALTPSLWENETPIAYVTRERKQVNALRHMAAEEVLRLDVYGRARGIEIPNG